MTSQRILMRAGRPPHDTTPNEAAYAWRATGHFGSNTGNMMFSDAVYTVLKTPGTEITCDAYAPEWREFTDDEAAYVNDNFDAYVLPMANAIRAGFAENQLSRLASLFKRLTIPVVVTGIGADTVPGKGASVFPEESRRAIVDFVGAVLDRSASICVRGEHTREVLLDLGFSDDSVEVIGCPSLFTNGREFSIESDPAGIGPESRLATSLEVPLDGLGDFYLANEERYPDLVSVYQKLDGGDLILWGQSSTYLPEGTPRSIHDRAYREGRLRFFTNPVPWRQFMRERDFAFGIRIHGTIAALTAGTPAHLLTIDSRTEEIARHHGIPSSDYAEFIAAGDLLAEGLYERSDFTEFNRRMPENWDRYYAFLERNGLEHIEQPGKANPEYAELLRTFSPAPGIVPVSAADPAGLASRFAWLRQGRAYDHGRARRAFRPDFALDKTYVEAPQKGISILKGQNRKLRERTTQLEKRVAELEEYAEYLRRPFGARLRDAVGRRLGRR